MNFEIFKVGCRSKYSTCRFVLPRYSIITALPMHSSRFFRVKPIGRLFYEVQKIGKPYNFLPIPTIKYIHKNTHLLLLIHCQNKLFNSHNSMKKPKVSTVWLYQSTHIMGYYYGLAIHWILWVSSISNNTLCKCIRIHYVCI